MRALVFVCTPMNLCVQPPVADTTDCPCVNFDSMEENQRKTHQDGFPDLQADGHGRLFPSPVFGPVHSRRLGVSLGVNLLPADGKVCSFDCIYCECGYNAERRPHQRFPSREDVREALRTKLDSMRQEGVVPDVLTFAGNGEPTLHPEFLAVIEDTCRLRDEFCPQARITVLSNAAELMKDDVFRALQLVDNNCLKLDTVSQDYIRRVDRPVLARYDVTKVIERMKQFRGHCTIQTLFLRGRHEGCDVGNTGDNYVGPWLEVLREIGPQEVQVYTIDRQTPSPLLEKATPQELDRIAEQVRALGIACQVSY